MTMIHNDIIGLAGHRAHAEVQAKAHLDLLVTASQLTFGETGPGKAATLSTPEGTFKLSEHAEEQLASILQVPGKYYHRCRRASMDLTVTTMNFWLNHTMEGMVVRCKGETVRAVLSPRYEIVDNVDVLQALEKVLQDYDQWKVHQFEVTEEGMYLKVLLIDQVFTVRNSRLGVEYTYGAGYMVRNSEVGLATVSVIPFVMDLQSKLVRIAAELGDDRRHVGKHKSTSQDCEVLASGIHRFSQHRIIHQLNESINNLMESKKFYTIIQKIQVAEGRLIENAVRLWKGLGEMFKLSKEERGEMSDIFMGLPEYTQAQVSGCFSLYAQQLRLQDKPGRAFDFEAMAYEILCLSESELRKLSI